MYQVHRAKNNNKTIYVWVSILSSILSIEFLYNIITYTISVSIDEATISSFSFFKSESKDNRQKQKIQTTKRTSVSLASKTGCSSGATYMKLEVESVWTFFPIIPVGNKLHYCKLHNLFFSLFGAQCQHTSFSMCIISYIGIFDTNWN